MRNTLSSVVIKHEIQKCENNLKIEKNIFFLLAEGIRNSSIIIPMIINLYYSVINIFGQ